LIAIVIASTFFYSCEKDENPNLFANEQLLLTMDNWYLWYDKMPDRDPENYPSPVELLNSLVYTELDRWSYITTKQELEAYYTAGEYIGFGIGVAFDTNNQLWITFVFDESPLKEYGVDRGWRIAAIDGTTPTPENTNSLLGPATAGLSKTFTLQNPAMETVTITVTKGTLAMNTVLMDSVYSIGTGKVGYFVLKGFITPTIEELNESFNHFLTEGVTDLIVDLRYNGGGSVTTASHLADLIAGNANGQVLGTYVHNDKHTADNESIIITQQANSLSLSRIVFITTRNSASASELVINGLFPHLDVTLVGDDTYGKPVGMYAFTSPSFDWAFVPICFKILNANGEGDYYDGIPADIGAIDGINYAFGDLDEPSLSAAISFLESGTVKKGVSSSERMSYPKLKGLREEIGSW
jgi:C-terminal processing protease CtpA/Prc